MTWTLFLGRSAWSICKLITILIYINIFVYKFLKYSAITSMIWCKSAFWVESLKRASTGSTERRLTLVRHLRKASRTCRYSFLPWARTLNGPQFWIERISQRTGQRNRQRTPRLLLSKGLAVDVTQTQSRVCGSGIWFKIPTVHDKPARLTKCVPAHLLWKMQEAKRKKCVDRWDGMPLILLWIFASVGGLISSNLIFLEKCHGFFFSHFSKFRSSL